MQTWTEGYQQGTDYIHGYQPHLNPARLPLYFLNAGLVAPSTAIACELGFGFGESLNLHAAASTTIWFGTDFHAGQTAYAQALAGASGAAAQLFDQAFADFCQRRDLPDFDFIALHGIWSWISDENRKILVDFFARKLKAGGVLYMGYNTPVAYAAFSPIRDVLTGHAQTMTLQAAGSTTGIRNALEFAQKLLTLSSGFTRANPDMPTRVSQLQQGNLAYVAHEYFNQHWVPTSFSKLTEWLAPAKLEFACSASYFDAVDAWNLTADQQALLKDIADSTYRESVRDFMMNRGFRRDYWVKGACRLSIPEKIEGLRNQRVILTRPLLMAEGKATGALGTFVPNPAIYKPVIDCLGDHKPKSLRQIEQAVKDQGVNLLNVVEVVMTLLETSTVAAVQDEAVIRAARKQTDKLNAYLCARAPFNTDLPSVLASPVIGTGLIQVGRVVQFFWQAIQQGKKLPAQLAAHAAQMFRGDILLLDEEKKFVSADAGNLDALTVEANYFLEKLLPLLKALHIT